MGGWLHFGRGEVGCGRRRERRRRYRGREEERVSAKAVYTGVYRRNIPSVNPSLLGCPGLNPSVFPSVNSS